MSKEYGNKIIYAGPEKEKKIYLYMHNNHYDVITKMPGFFTRHYFCHTCKKAYDHKDYHRCLNDCNCCGFPFKCPDCQGELSRLSSIVQHCYEQHKQSRGDARSVCQSLVKCTKCEKLVDRCKQLPEKHRCGLCWICGKFVQLQGDNTRSDFCELMFTTEHANYTVMAHNFQGCDSYFVLQYLREHGIKYDVIMRGVKVLSLTVDMFNIRFVDSLNFIPMKLANFPKAFGIEELAKGYFPYLFNKKENESYVGPIPPSPYYNPNEMNPKDRETFVAWHTMKKENHYVFNFQEEIVTYCRSDVDILRRCCLEFRKLFYNVTDIDPFTALTIASVCYLVYRTNYLPKDTIAIIPPLGYCPKNKQSLFAHKWLSYTAEKNETYIQHARNGGKKRVGPYLLDGYHQETHTVYEVHGCFWHGCPRCYARDTVNPVNGKTTQELHCSTVEKIEYLRRQGYNVVEIWECDVNRELNNDEDMKYYFDHYHIADSLEPRDAL